MAVAHDSSTTSTVADAVESVHTIAHTCSGSNRCLVVWFGIQNQTTAMVGATYAGVSMTTLINSNSAGQPPRSVGWILANPASGTNNVVITTGDVNNIRHIHVHSATGVDQTTPSSGTASSAAANANPSAVSVGISSAIGDLVYDFFASAGGASASTITAEGNQTELGNFRAGVSGVMRTGSSWRAGASSVSMYWDTTMNTSTDYRLTAVNLSAAAAATGFPAARLIGGTVLTRGLTK